MINFRRMRELIKSEERLHWALERERAKAEKITTSLSKSGGSSVRTSSKVEDGAIAIAIIQEEYDLVVEELKRLRKELSEQLKVLTELQRTIIRMRYIEGYSCRRIAEDLHYDDSYMYKVIASAEDRINEQSCHKKTMRI